MSKGKTIQFPDFDMDHAEIVCGDRERPEFIAATLAVGDHLETIKWESKEQFYKLIELVNTNITEAERGAFMRGLAIGKEVGLHYDELCTD